MASSLSRRAPGSHQPSSQQSAISRTMSLSEMTPDRSLPIVDDDEWWIFLM